MSLAIAFKGTEGIVLAADSRVTLTAQLIANPPGGQGGPQTVLLPATFDNATKLLKITGQKYVGAVTYGLGALGVQQPRTAHSFMPEFEAQLAKECNGKRLKVSELAESLAKFFMNQWELAKMPAQQEPMVFYVAGYNEGEPYGRIYEIRVPGSTVPKEWHEDQFGVVWGGQSEFVQRLITGYDPQLCNFAQQFLKFPDDKRAELDIFLKSRLQAAIPFQFLPLQDCVNLAVLLIRATMTIQTFLVGMRGVGGAIDVATITATEGIKLIQMKTITGEMV